MKVWLDDIRDPNDPYIQQHYGAEPDMVWVKSAEEAIALLRTGTVTMISLDHDLGEDDDGNDLPSGMTVANAIEEMAYFKEIPQLQAFVHSDNTVGAPAMRVALANAQRYFAR